MRDWLAVTKELQASFHPASERAPGTEGWRRYVEYNALAVHSEVTEFLREVEIRPWKSPTGVVLDREAAKEELVDVAHFLANLAIALDITDAEWDRAYRVKVEENYSRLERGRSVPTDLADEAPCGPCSCPDCKPKAPHRVEAFGGYVETLHGVDEYFEKS